jgi:hypothetical protein
VSVIKISGKNYVSFSKGGFEELLGTSGGAYYMDANLSNRVPADVTVRFTITALVPRIHAGGV